VDSLQDSVRVQEVIARFSKLLKLEKLDIDFTINRSEGMRRDEFLPPAIEMDNEVSVGFAKPVTFKMNQNTANHHRKVVAPDHGLGVAG
jgi:hypothetical protein